MSLTKVSYSMIQGAVVNVLDYGANADGTNDSSAINAAIASIAATGGAVYFPSGIYGISSQILVDSAKPITLFGDGASSQIRIIGNITGSMIKYAASGGGGGRIRDLFLYDATTSSGLPGSYTCTAGLHLEGFTQSLVQNVTITGINCTATTGGAILGVGCVQSVIANCILQYCNEGINLASASTGIDSCQALNITDCHIEDIVGKSIYVNANSNQVKIIGCGFETGVVGGGYAIHVVNGAAGTAIEGCHFNRAPDHVIFLGSTTRVVGNYFQSLPDPVDTIYVAGDSNVITGNTFNGDSTTRSIYLFSGNNNVIDGNIFRLSGGVQFGLSGQTVKDTVVSNNSFLDLYADNTQGYWVVDGPNSTGTVIEGNTFRDSTNGPVKTQGFVLVNGAQTVVTGNAFVLRQASYDIYCQSSDALINGNTGVDAYADATGSKASWANNYFSVTGEPFYSMAGPALGTGWTVSATSTVNAYAHRSGDHVRLSINITPTGGGTIAATSSATITGIPTAWQPSANPFVTGSFYAPGTGASGLCYIVGGTVYFSTALSATSAAMYVVLDYYKGPGGV